MNGQSGGGLGDLPISPTNSHKDEKRSDAARRALTAWWLTRAFDPVGRAGYEAPNVSA
jgi:hypothetical protein